MLLVLAACAVFLSAGGAEAFCIYNESYGEIYACQISGDKTLQGFSGFLKPGEHKCCNWQDPGCNADRKPESTVRFNVITIDDLEQKVLSQITGRCGNGGCTKTCDRISIRADGWAAFRIFKGNYRCVTGP